MGPFTDPILGLLQGWVSERGSWRVWKGLSTSGGVFDELFLYGLFLSVRISVRWELFEVTDGFHWEALPTPTTSQSLCGRGGTPGGHPLYFSMEGRDSDGE